MNSLDFLNKFIADIYGYAVNRTASTDDAEDLAQDILVAVIDSFRRNPGVSEPERYMWKIAHNVYVDHVRKGQKIKNQVEFSVLSNLLPDKNPALIDNVLEQEQFDLMKREIARLSEIRRKIVVMRYFEEKPLKEIAERLSISVGTVKWHLNGLRGEIGKGMNVMRTNGALSINPIKFDQIQYCGREGYDGGPQTLLASSIRQNILYAAYRKPLSVNEIADEMGVSPPYIHEEVGFLMDYNFINEVEKGKFQANIILDDYDNPLLDALYGQAEAAAKRICGELICEYKKNEQEIINSGIYIPKGNTEFLRWTAFVQAVIESLAFIKFDNSNLPPHKDGNYIVIAHVDTGVVPQSRNAQEAPTLYYLYGPMVNWQAVKYGMWRVDHNWVKREPLREYGRRDIGFAGAFRDGQLPLSKDTAEQYQYLLENGLIVKENGQYYLNVIFADNADIYKKYKAALPNIKDTCESMLGGLSDRVYDKLIKSHPGHLDKQLKLFSHIVSSYTISPLILRFAVEDGFLPRLSSVDEKSASILIGEFGAKFV